MENCVAPGLDEFDVLLEVVLSLVRVQLWQLHNVVNINGFVLTQTKIAVSVKQLLRNMSIWW